MAATSIRLVILGSRVKAGAARVGGGRGASEKLVVWIALMITLEATGQLGELEWLVLKMGEL